MRRSEKEITDGKILEEILHSAPVCRIGLAPSAPTHPYPYIVPLHFVYSEGRIYFHSAGAGKKTEMLGKNNRVCVEVDEFSEIVPADRPCSYGSRYRSVIAFGRAHSLEEEAEKQRALRLLMEKYTGRSFDFSARDVERVVIIEIQLEEVTGKQGN